MPSAFITSGTASRSSVTISTLPLYLRVEEVVDRGDVGRLCLFTIRPVIPPCQGIEKSWFGSVSAGFTSGFRCEKRRRERLLVELLDVAEVVHLLRQPVAGDHQRTAARLAVGEQRLHLAEELVVAVDVLDVLRPRSRSAARSPGRSSCRCRAPSSRSSGPRSARPRPARSRPRHRRLHRPRSRLSPQAARASGAARTSGASSRDELRSACLLELTSISSRSGLHGSGRGRTTPRARDGSRVFDLRVGGRAAAGSAAGRRASPGTYAPRARDRQRRARRRPR